MIHVHRLSWTGAIILVGFLEALAGVAMQWSQAAAWTASLIAAATGLLWVRLRRSIRAEFTQDRVRFYDVHERMYLEVDYREILDVQLKRSSYEDLDYYLTTQSGQFRLPTTLEGSKKMIAFFEEIGAQNSLRKKHLKQEAALDWARSGMRGVRRLIR